VKSDRLGRLFWCIEQIEAKPIRRGMSTNELKAVFGDSLDHYHIGKAYSLLSSRPTESDPALATAQWGPMWEIDFTINESGFVTDYSLTKAGEK
jgi:hypothetical protein